MPSSTPTATLSKPFTPGNLLLVRVGSGFSPLTTTSSSAPVYLEEYEPSGGSLVQTMKLTGGLINASVPFSLSGKSSPFAPEGLLAVSNNALFASLGAYHSPTSTGVLARIAGNSLVDASTHFTTAPTTTTTTTTSLKTLTNVSSVVFSNAGDVAYACRTLAGGGGGARGCIPATGAIGVAQMTPTSPALPAP